MVGVENSVTMPSAQKSKRLELFMLVLARLASDKAMLYRRLVSEAAES
jgi:hypothetical protein